VQSTVNDAKRGYSCERDLQLSSVASGTEREDTPVDLHQASWTFRRAVRVLRRRAGGNSFRRGFGTTQRLRRCGGEHFDFLHVLRRAANGFHLGKIRQSCSV